MKHDGAPVAPDHARDVHARARERFRAVFSSGASAVLADADGTTIDATGPLASVAPGTPAELLANGDDRHELRSWLHQACHGEAEAPGGTFTTVLGDQLSVRIVRVQADDRPDRYLVLQLQLLPSNVEKLRHTERLYRTWFEQAPTGMAVVAIDGLFVDANPAVCALLERPLEALRSLRFQDVTHPDDLLCDVELLERTLAGEINRYQIDKRYITGSGTVVWADLKVALLRDAAGEPLHFISMISDITEQKRTGEQLQAALTQLAEAFDLNPTPSLQTTLDGAVLRANRAAELVASVPPSRQATIVDFVEPGDARPVLEALQRLSDPGALHRSCELPVRDPSGRKRQLSAVLLAPGSGAAGVLIQMAPASDAVRMRQLEHAATHDDLTGLANRARLEHVVGAALLRSPTSPLAVLFLDLDRFKDVNDQFGHRAGDGLLVAVADALRRATRRTDLAGRVGGDEFAVVLPDTDGATAGSIARSIEAELAAVRGVAGPITATIGVAVSEPGRGTTVQELIAAADSDLYQRRRQRAASPPARRRLADESAPWAHAGHSVGSRHAAGHDPGRSPI